MYCAADPDGCPHPIQTGPIGYALLTWPDQRSLLVNTLEVNVILDVLVDEIKLEEEYATFGTTTTDTYPLLDAIDDA